MRYCSACGYKIIDGDPKYCPECGSLLDKPDENTDVKRYDTKGRDLLIDYYEKGVDTPYYELVLYNYNPNELILEEYIDGGSKSEKCFQKLVPMEAYQKALEVVDNFSLKALLNRKGIGLDGMTYVIRFRESLTAKDVYRFSSENVGEKDTIMMFSTMKNVLSSYKH